MLEPVCLKLMTVGDKENSLPFEASTNIDSSQYSSATDQNRLGLWMYFSILSNICLKLSQVKTGILPAAFCSMLTRVSCDFDVILNRLTHIAALVTSRDLFELLGKFIGEQACRKVVHRDCLECRRAAQFISHAIPIGIIWLWKRLFQWRTALLKSPIKSQAEWGVGTSVECHNLIFH